MKTDKRKPGFRRTLSNLLFLIKPYWKYGRVLVIVDLITRIFLYPIRIIAEVTIAQAIIEAAQSGRGAGHVAAVAVTYVVITVGCWIIREMRVELLASWKAPQISAGIEREIYEQAMRTDYKYVDTPEFFDDYKIATEEYVNRATQMYDSAAELLGELSGLLTAAGIIAVTEPGVVIIIMIGLALSAIFRGRKNINDNSIWKETTIHRRRMNYLTRLLYTKAANADLHSTKIGDSLLDNFDKAMTDRVAHIKKYVPRQFANGTIRISSERLALYLVMVWTALRFVSGKIKSVGTFTTLIAATSKLANNLANVTIQFTDMMTMTLYAEKVRSFFELRSDIEPQPKTAGAAPPDGALSIALCGVSFTYPNANFGLKNLNISIAPGEKIAIVGENGAGKTTLSKLLLRLYDIGSGEILYNGKPVTAYNIHALRRRIGVAFQDPQLYALTVRENMCVYNKSDDDTLRAVLKTVGLDLDLDAEVTREFDESGAMFSGGEAQKLALSRLLHGDFGLLLLDEPSSALDPIAEYEMTKLMFERSRTTTIMVAHRLSTIRSADRIYLIADGEVAEQGTHEELIALAGKYAEMFAKQAENYVR
jgi:ATP-binding cassette subfamily B protein